MAFILAWDINRHNKISWSTALKESQTPGLKDELKMTKDISSSSLEVVI